MKTRDDKIADITDAHGCMTGDCYHGINGDCSHALRAYVSELAENVVDEEEAGKKQKDEASLLHALVIGIWARSITLCCDAVVVAHKDYSIGFVALNILGWIDKGTDLINKQAEEIRVLRLFGNKDCTAQADEHLAKLQKEKDGEGT